MNGTRIIIVSGGTGTSGDQLVRTALAQFADVQAPISIVGQVRDLAQIEQVVLQAAASDALIAHTLVDLSLRHGLIDLAKERHVAEVDLIGPVLASLQYRLQQPPLGQPGLYRKSREHDFKRIEAIEFAVSHDDGQRVHELGMAEIVLTGISRVGKTPLSVYLSTMGWKVANIPLIKDIEPPDELFEIDPRRVVGLIVEAGQLIAYRQRRQQYLGTLSGAPYAEPEALAEELDYARSVFRRGGFTTLDMTDKPIEESAHDAIGIITRKLKAYH
jgi:regulator of PEP synthase PpsR (kinase-PPPase family)